MSVVVSDWNILEGLLCRKHTQGLRRSAMIDLGPSAWSEHPLRALWFYDGLRSDMDRERSIQTGWLGLKYLLVTDKYFERPAIPFASGERGILATQPAQHLPHYGRKFRVVELSYCSLCMLQLGCLCPNQFELPGEKPSLPGILEFFDEIGKRMPFRLGGRNKNPTGSYHTDEDHGWNSYLSYLSIKLCPKISKQVLVNVIYKRNCVSGEWPWMCFRINTETCNYLPNEPGGSGMVW